MFAYGATGAGKTYTMLGSEQSPGIMYLTMAELYRRIEARRDEKSCEVLVSYQEVRVSPVCFGAAADPIAPQCVSLVLGEPDVHTAVPAGPRLTKLVGNGCCRFLPSGEWEVCLPY